MSIERFDLAPADDGREQYAMIERRPTRDQLKEIEKKLRQAHGLETEAQDGLMAVLVDSWVLFDRDGNVVPPPRQGTKALGRVDAHFMAPLITELASVVEAVDRGKAIAQVRATLLLLSAQALDSEKAERVEAIADELDAIFEATPPNG